MSRGSATEVMNALHALRDLARAFASRETRLQAACYSSSGKEKRARDEAIEAIERQRSDQVASLDARLAEITAAIDKRCLARASRIDDASNRALERELAAIEDTRGRRKFTLQKERLDLERKRDADLSAVERVITTFRKADEQLTAHEKAARCLFRNSRTFEQWMAANHALDEETLDLEPAVGEMNQLIADTEASMDSFRSRGLPKVFGRLVPWLFVSLIPAGTAIGMSFTGSTVFPLPVGCAVSGAFLMLTLILWAVATSQTKPVMTHVAACLGRARGLHDAFAASLDAWKQEHADVIHAGFSTAMNEHEQQWIMADDSASTMSAQIRQRVEERHRKLQEKHAASRNRSLNSAQAGHEAALEEVESAIKSQRKALETATREATDGFARELESGLATLEMEWRDATTPLCAVIQQAEALDHDLFSKWSDDGWKDWQPPASHSAAARFGTVTLEMAALCDVAPKDARFALPLKSQMSLPALVLHPDAGNVVLETGASGREAAIGCLNALVLRLLAGSPAGKARFTFIDPVSLGQSFSALMHLADYEERLVNNRIWTQSTQIDEKLGELNEHMEKVIQMYLRNDYRSIVDYNRQAGNIAEPYHFVVVADFPSGFNDSAARRLISIATSGARCGVFVLLHWDRRQPQPHGFVPDALREGCQHVAAKGLDWVVNGIVLPGARMALLAPPADGFVTEFIHKVGATSRDSNRVEVPFSHVAPAGADIWSADTTEELRVPIGRTAATKLQYLALGRDTRQHALVAGKTGSGKSTLFHIAITNLALWCSPDQVEFYLIDFKKGVEFKTYATHRLPHARVVAIESDREFGLSVLQRVDEELRWRGDLFRKVGSQNLAGYRKSPGAGPMPRCLLLIDEFQELFVEDDKISQSASVLLDRIVRQGRAFGIHVILGSQTLGGAYTVARATLGQMVVRIALQCNEADAYLIMDDGNPAPRLLTRPGEGIYNDAAGALQGNSPFQAVWLPDDVRDAALSTARVRADHTTHPGPIVFEGNAPAEVRENNLLAAMLRSGAEVGATPRLWLGAPNAIKGPTECVFQRQSGNHLLVVGQRDEAVLSMLGIALVTLAAQSQSAAARLLVLDASPVDSPERRFLEQASCTVPRSVEFLKYGDIADTLRSLVDELDRRASEQQAGTPPVFLFIHHMERFSKLKHEDDFSFSSDEDAGAKPDALLARLISDGPGAGIHVVATFDTCNNVNRFLSRKLLGELEMRVLFQMSANDSALLMDSPRAGSLGLHRAVLYNLREGTIEVFRPYALPDAGWFEQAAHALKSDSPD